MEIEGIGVSVSPRCGGAGTSRVGAARPLSTSGATQPTSSAPSVAGSMVRSGRSGWDRCSFAPSVRSVTAMSAGDDAPRMKFTQRFHSPSVNFAASCATAQRRSPGRVCPATRSTSATSSRPMALMGWR